MDIIGFFGSVWLAIFAGIFFIAMIIGCTYDRRQQEDAKWWIFGIGAIAYAIYSYTQGYRPTIDSIIHADIWRVIGIYLAIGLGYSIIEFVLDVRRSVRYWRETWTAFRSNRAAFSKNKDGDRVESPKDIANDFVAKGGGRYSRRIIGVELNDKAVTDNELIVPRVDRVQLAEHIGCWIVFWPFYAVSLIIGDLVMELARIIADIFAKISGRFVRLSFANVFKF